MVSRSSMPAERRLRNRRPAAQSKRSHPTGRACERGHAPCVMIVSRHTFECGSAGAATPAELAALRPPPQRRRRRLWARLALGGQLRRIEGKAALGPARPPPLVLRCSLRRSDGC